MMRRLFATLTVLFVLCAAAIVMATEQAPAAKAPAAPAPKAEAPAPAVAPAATDTAAQAAPQFKPEDVVAKVGEKSIKYSDLTAEMDKMQGQFPPDMRKSLEPRVLDGMIRQIAMQQYLDQLKAPQVDEETFKKELAKLEDQVKERQGGTLKEFLEKEGRSYDDFTKQFKEGVRVISYLRKQVGDTEVQQYFTEHKAELDKPEMVKASHILITTDEMSDTEALAKIKEIKAKLDKGADFAVLAKEFSKCPSAERGGDLGFFPREGAMVEEFSAVAFKLKEGEISDPVKTQFGYHLIKVTGKKPALEATLENSKDDVRDRVAQQKFRKFQQEVMDKIKVENKYPVEEAPQRPMPMPPAAKDTAPAAPAPDKPDTK